MLRHRQMPPHQQVVAGVTALTLAGLVYSDTVVTLVGDWFRDDNYSHGVLVVPAALYVTWRNRQRLLSSASAPSSLGAVTVAASLVVLLIGRAGIELFLSRISLIGVLIGAVAFLTGWARVRALAFPFSLLLLMIPLPAIVFNQIAFPLQLLASRLGVWLLRLVDVPVLREGNLIMLPATTLEVAEACSGIRSLMSLVMIAILYGYLVYSHWVPRWTVVLGTVPIAIFANAFRIAVTGVLTVLYGSDVALGFLHALSGWALFGFSVTLLLGVSWLVQQFCGLLAPNGKLRLA